MKILAIETSCDETAISIIETKGGLKKTKIKVLSNIVLSQVKLHAKYGGVFPTLAKREHAKNIIPLLKKSLSQAGLLEVKTKTSKLDQKNTDKITDLFLREPGLLEQFFKLLTKIKTPKIDLIVVTSGPGLEPALWVGINFAKALSLFWNKPLIPINHMEGHIFSSLMQKISKTDYVIQNIKFPIIALLISGGHTEIILMKDWLKYKIVGQTRDDASGEAFDKVARMLSLPYPGGPEISILANNFKPNKSNPDIKFPRPMINSSDFDFSFSGLKTAVLYKIQDLKKQKIKLSKKIKEQISYEFQEAVIEVLTKKTIKSVLKHKAKLVVLGGGVSANKKIRDKISSEINNLSDINVSLPDQILTGDNALMIAVAGYFKYLKNKNKVYKNIKAQGNLRLS